MARNNVWGHIVQGRNVRGQNVRMFAKGARIKYKLMGFMVYFYPAKNKNLLLYG
jgi:hypothetical protein